MPCSPVKGGKSSSICGASREVKNEILRLDVFGPLSVVMGAGAAQVKSKANVQRGEEVYKSLCWTCHGNYGRGDGPAAKYLAYPPPDFTDPRVLGQKSDEQILSGPIAA